MKIIQKIYEIFQKNPVISTDSRNIIPSSIFFALKGKNFNGNLFAQEALNKGASVAIIDEPAYKKNDDQYIVVNNTLESLQKLATYHRQKLKITVIAITGSNGKTTTKELITAVLNKKYNALSTEGNLNNHIGVPLTLLSINNKHDIAVIEMGANHQGEIAQLSNIAKPDAGLITNIGKAHIEGFGSLDGVIKAKTELYQFLSDKNGSVFINADNNILSKELKKYHLNHYSYGTHDSSDCSGIIRNTSNIFLEVQLDDNNTIIKTNLAGDYNFENVMAACCVGKYYNIPTNDIKNAIENYHPANNRSQIKKTEKNNTLFLDLYNANSTSMLKAIEYFVHQNHKKNKILILGDMLELGKDSEKEHLAILNKVGTYPISNLMFVGSIFSEAGKENRKGYFFNNVEELINWLKKNNIENSFILIKGSREIKLEKTIPFL